MFFVAPNCLRGLWCHDVAVTKDNFVLLQRWTREAAQISPAVCSSPTMHGRHGGTDPRPRLLLNVPLSPGRAGRAGEIPWAVKKLTNLESLKLNNNKLEGKILGTGLFR